MYTKRIQESRSHHIEGVLKLKSYNNAFSEDHFITFAIDLQACKIIKLTLCCIELKTEWMIMTYTSCWISRPLNYY